MAALSRAAAIVQAVAADPAAPSRVAVTVLEVEEADPVGEAIVLEAEAGQVAEATVRVGADPAEGRADSDEAGRATTVAERFAASALTRSSTLITRTLTAFAGT